MKEIKAYVRNNMVDQVIAALAGIDGMSGIAVVELRAFGHAPSNDTLTRVEMTKLEIVVGDHLVDVVVDCIVRSARTGSGHPGDGRVFVSELDDAVRIEDGTHS